MDSNTNFLERFKGKISKIDKDGHVGVALKSFKPIKKNPKPLYFQNVSERKFSQSLHAHRNKSLGSIKVNHNRRRIFEDTLSKHEESMNDYGRNDVSLTPDITGKSAKAANLKMKVRAKEIMPARKTNHRRINLGEIGNLSLKSIREKETSYTVSKPASSGYHQRMLMNQKKTKLPQKVKLHGTQEGYNQYKLPQDLVLRREKTLKDKNRFRKSSLISNSVKPLDSTNYTDSTGDYAIFKVSYGLNSTTVTEMGDSGISLTETHGTCNPLMRRSKSISNTHGSQQSKRPFNNTEILPLIHKYRRAMQSPRSEAGSYSLGMDRGISVLS